MNQTVMAAINRLEEVRAQEIEADLAATGLGSSGLDFSISAHGASW